MPRRSYDSKRVFAFSSCHSQGCFDDSSATKPRRKRRSLTNIERSTLVEVGCFFQLLLGDRWGRLINLKAEYRIFAHTNQRLQLFNDFPGMNQHNLLWIYFSSLYLVHPRNTAFSAKDFIDLRYPVRLLIVMMKSMFMDHHPGVIHVSRDGFQFLEGLRSILSRRHLSSVMRELERFD
jgi:hypothetical protein